MKPSREPLGHLELDVLQYVCDHHPITVRDVAAHFAATSGHARTTLLTVMERLRCEGAFGPPQNSGRRHYAPTVSKADLLDRIVGDFVDEVLGGSVSPFVAYLSRSPPISPDEAQARTNARADRIARKKGLIHERLARGFGLAAEFVAKVFGGRLAGGDRARRRLGHRPLVYLSFAARDLLGLAFGLPEVAGRTVWARAGRSALCCRHGSRPDRGRRAGNCLCPAGEPAG